MSDSPEGEAIRRLLTDPERAGAPEPTLLPWLARHIAPAALPEVARAAASVGALAPRNAGWPVIADAVAQIIAERSQALDALDELIDILPPLAGHLGSEQREHVSWPSAGVDSLCYAILGGQLSGDLGAAAAERLLRQERRSSLWIPVLRALPSRRLPPLADLRSLAWYAASTVPGRVAETDDAAVYLLPFRFGGDAAEGQSSTQLRQAIEAITIASRDGRYWYATALAARVGPFLNDTWLAQARAIGRGLPAPWGDSMGRSLGRRGLHWQSDEEELTGSHPAAERLTELAAMADPENLAEVCLEVTRRIVDQYRLSGTWAPDYEDWEPAILGANWESLISQSAGSGTTSTDRAWNRELDDGDQHLLGIAEPESARFVNIYVAQAGQDQPVRGVPITPGATYEVCCNIGPTDVRSLLDSEAAAFPEELVPDAPLELHAVLYADNQATASATILLPAAGASQWVRLPLPPATEASVIRGELAIYYRESPVLVYSLTIPVGGSRGRGPEAKLLYRLSRSLTDLDKLAGRALSVLVPASAVYVNGLDFAPQAFSHNPNLIKQAAHATRQVLYRAHFKVESGQEKSRYTPGSGRRHQKSLPGLEDDLRNLARFGAQIYTGLFAPPAGPFFARRLRAEASARGRPPIAAVASLAGELLPVPWAALYDLPMLGVPGDYEPCPSIAQFGPGGSGGEPPACCPYENEHRDYENENRDGGSWKWKLNQLCPWGFWGLSTIIEHPPSVESRDLEVRAGHPGEPPTIQLGYDTDLSPGPVKQHISVLREDHGRALLEPLVVNRSRAIEVLRANQMDILYFYCHIRDDTTAPWQIIPAIGLGTELLTAQDINGVAYIAEPGYHPLVILNGCHSVEVGPGELYNFVNPFIQGFQASGLVGTETAMDQGVAGWAMELFLSRLRTQPVGMALRSVRWEMLRSGNIMGFAYTPYCLAGLTLAPRTMEEA